MNAEPLAQATPQHWPARTLLGVDVGSRRVKAAVWDPSGTRVAEVWRPLPALGYHGGIPGQDPAALLMALESALVALGVEEVEGLALTTQRDTLLLVDPEENPRSPLLSWRERRALEEPEARARLLGPGSEVFPHQTLEAWLLGRWQQAPPLPGLAPEAIRVVGGDKNCEYLALRRGGDRGETGVGALSLGTAISLGIHRATPPDAPRPATVILTPGAGFEGWDVETGLLSGMEGLGHALSLAGFPPDVARLDSEPVLALHCDPNFFGSLRDPSAQGGLRWRDGTPVAPGQLGLTAEGVARSWAEGVVQELQGLRGALEAVAGLPLTALRVGGGGAVLPGWGPLLEAAFQLPVQFDSDPWLGCRGAVMAWDSLPSPQPSPNR